MDEWASIRFLRVKGVSIRAIAKELGISRNTVSRALAQVGPPEYKRARKVNPQLEPFTEAIRENITKSISSVPGYYGNCVSWGIRGRNPPFTGI